jgi:23S rRNA pseudouridine1911/1915/1917 synthase
MPRRRPSTPSEKSPAASRDVVFHIVEAEEGRTLAHGLRRFAPDLSWTDIRKRIAGRRVQVNGNLCLDEARRLVTGDVVKVLAHPAAAPPRESDIRIRYLDRHIVIVEKPAGMTTLRHPEERDWPQRRKQLQPTLDETLPALVEKLASRREKTSKGVPPRLRAVHRLDRETSGLMVFARTIAAESALGKQFRAHELDRHYIGVCLGEFRGGTLESNLIEDRGDGRRGSTRFPNQGKRAVTHVTPLEQLPGYTVVQCQLETGRTHQIRIHLSEAGHPLCGDRVYRGPFPPARENPTGLPDHSGAPRVALHAADLGLTHPITGEKLRFGMPLPQDIVDLVDRLRGKSAPPPRLSLAEPVDELGVIVKHDEPAPRPVAVPAVERDERPVRKGALIEAAPKREKGNAKATGGRSGTREILGKRTVGKPKQGGNRVAGTKPQKPTGPRKPAGAKKQSRGKKRK